jgi:signal transduction histidine kinase
MGLHQWFDGTTTHVSIPPLADGRWQPEAESLDVDRPLPPWLDISFLNRLDALNDRPLPTGERARPADANADAILSESIASFAHEVRTPLATIQATLEILSDDLPLDSGDLRPLVERLQRGTTWIAKLVENLASSPEHQEDTAPLKMEPTSVRDWIESAIALVQPIADRRNQTILLACPRPSPVVCGDPFRLGQVIVNLLTNACRYGAWADTIAVSVSVSHRSVSIRVSDHGIGILPEERDRIFERLVRGTQVSGNHVRGQGLGLHIVREIVERHGGTIGVESTIGQGSTFTVRLPAMSALRPLILRHTVIEEGTVSE